jgi:hypothetical protein
MRRFLALVLVLAAAGCGGDESADDGGDVTPTTPAAKAVAADTCLSDNGFSIQPAASGVSAVTPSGIAFTITFLATPAAATSAAENAGRTAVDNAVVTATGKQIPKSELGTIEDCIRGAAD